MSDPALSTTVGFIGAGKMATALALGLIRSGCVPAERICASDPYPSAAEAFHKATGAAARAGNADVWRQSQIVFLAVKPQQMADVLAEAASHLRSEHLVISIAAGVPISRMVKSLGDSARIVRVMPNTPCLVSAGASAFALGGQATAEDARTVEQLLSTVGLAVQVSESLLDAVTGLSGSGPAYVFQIIEALSDGGVRMGLPRNISTQLAAQTLLGAAKMLLETGEHPGALKDAVTSPGGTTIAGLYALERGGLRAALMNAVEEATLRSRELGQSL